MKNFLNELAEKNILENKETIIVNFMERIKEYEDIVVTQEEFKEIEEYEAIIELREELEG